MSTLLSGVWRFIREEDAPTAVEYAVMLALIIVACIAAVTVLGQNARDTFQFTADQIPVAGGGTGS